VLVDAERLFILFVALVAQFYSRSVMSCGDIGVISETNEWRLLERQFDALAHEKSVGPDSIETIFDMEFRRRFSELITQTARHTSTNVYNWPRYVRP
jgi:hypothetical protein